MKAKIRENERMSDCEPQVERRGLQSASVVFRGSQSAVEKERGHHVSLVGQIPDVMLPIECTHHDFGGGGLVLFCYG